MSYFTVEESLGKEFSTFEEAFEWRERFGAIFDDPENLYIHFVDDDGKSFDVYSDGTIGTDQLFYYGEMFGWMTNENYGYVMGGDSILDPGDTYKDDFGNVYDQEDDYWDGEIPF